ncbi:2-deoxystreptamine glucosyltransferase [Roseimaritima multifibrata]|uniref:2-deoxystreptamine glucosyltransferase n=1 Tax=Roseimaritima multifibrata TaxID=1930274 RepID=A0A517MN87_9BACT|nr:glycosyltransferase [Roseimaritima multifibrata]QDS96340.1 2-deoxystreptamine glucosyltransferase [Roseimaritima multifibrata]
MTINAADSSVFNSAAQALLTSSCDRPLVIHARVISGTGGGPEKTILNSPRFLARHGYDSVCLYFRDPEDEGFSIVEQRADELEAPLIGVDDRGAADCRLLGRVRRALGNFQGRKLIWHGHDYKSNFVGLRLRKQYSMALVSTVHGWVLKTWKTPLYYSLDRWSLKRYDQVVCVSTDLHQDCQRLGLADERLHLIDNAIDLEQYQRTVSREAARTLIRAPQVKYLLGAVGRLSAEKGFDYLVESVSILRRKGIDVGVVIVGDGPSREELSAQVRELGLEDSVHFAGFVADPSKYYQAMDLYVLSSLREGLPNVLLEAMAYEIPVIATAVAGIPKLIDGVENGWLVEPGSAEKLGAAIGVAIDSASESRRRGMMGRKTIEDRFSFDSRMKEIVQVYGSLDCLTR